jgi:hypothetical protein
VTLWHSSNRTTHPSTIQKKRITMANTEIQYLKNEIKQTREDIRNLILVLIELKILKVTVDENGKAVYDTGNDE